MTVLKIGQSGHLLGYRWPLQISIHNKFHSSALASQFVQNSATLVRKPTAFSEKWVYPWTTQLHDTRVPCEESHQCWNDWLRWNWAGNFNRCTTSGMLGTTTEVAGIVKVSAKGPLPTRYDTYWPFTSLMVTKWWVFNSGIQSEYVSIAPYQGIFGDYGSILTNITTLPSIEKEENFRGGDWQCWPQMFEIKLKPNPPCGTMTSPMPMAPWGLCYSAANGRISLSYIVKYPRPLRINDGINLVLFHNKSIETCTINMIEVTVYCDS